MNLPFNQNEKLNNDAEDFLIPRLNNNQFNQL